MFVLKWRDVEQVGMRFGETIRIPVKYREALQGYVEEEGLIYVPRQGSDERLRSRSGYIATTRIASIQEEHGRWGSIVLKLEYTEELPNAVPFSQSGFCFETGTAYGENRSLQQKKLRPLDESRYHHILDMASLYDPELDDAWRGSDRGNGVLPPGLDEGLPPRRRQEVSSWVRQSWIRVRATRADGSCALTGFRYWFEGNDHFLQVAHVYPVARGGLDLLRNVFVTFVVLHLAFDKFLWSFNDDLSVVRSRFAPPIKHAPPFREGPLFTHRPVHERPDPEFVGWHRKQFDALEEARAERLRMPLQV